SFAIKYSVAEEHLYLGFSHKYRDSIFPLHTSISLFLLSYCDCKLFKIFLVPTGEDVSQWTRLCEISIPLAVEGFLTASPEHCQTIPPDILQLERKLGEPVRVHNDDKIRRQKLQQQKADAKATVPVLGKEATEEGKPVEMHEHPLPSLELSIAFSKLLVQEASNAVNREAAHIRRTKTSDLPLLDHVFAEGLYFTLADIVLLPCIHQFLVSSIKQGKNLVNLPLISSWYRRVQEVPGVKKAAGKCSMALLQLPELMSAPEEQLQDFSSVPDELEEENEDSNFIGGPRPTMTKLMENGIEAKFSPHPCPSWTLDWTNLPSAVNPGEGKHFYACVYVLNSAFFW
uniref:Glutathione S-transferase C-terminal domain containing n=1 Tax=Strix occidentalis caurina TaxID=311401 RepID=A0A8D0ET90_STROC